MLSWSEHYLKERIQVQTKNIYISQNTKTFPGFWTSVLVLYETNAEEISMFIVSYRDFLFVWYVWYVKAREWCIFLCDHCLNMFEFFLNHSEFLDPHRAGGFQWHWRLTCSQDSQEPDRKWRKTPEHFALDVGLSSDVVRYRTCNMLVFDTYIHKSKKRLRMFSNQSWAFSLKKGAEAMLMCGTTVLSQRTDRLVRLKERLTIGWTSCKDQAPEKKTATRCDKMWHKSTRPDKQWDQWDQWASSRVVHCCAMLWVPEIVVQVLAQLRCRIWPPLSPIHQWRQIRQIHKSYSMLFHRLIPIYIYN